MLLAILVNTIGVILCVWAYSRPWEWAVGPLRVLRTGAVLLVLAVASTLSALLVESEEARRLFITIGIAACLILLAREIGMRRRRSPLTSEVYAADTAPPIRKPRTQRGRANTYGSVTLEQIERMEVAS